MDERRIWAPWRLGYIVGEQDSAPAPPEPSCWQAGADRSCFMCRAAASCEDGPEPMRLNWVVAVGQYTLAMLNRYPYSNGHLLVTPKRHAANLFDLTAEEHLEGMQQLANLTKVLSKVISAEGFNVGLNLGRVAGAGVPGHLHWHLVPRWQGDHNFMPTLAAAQVIPQSLDALWEALTDGQE